MKKPLLLITLVCSLVAAGVPAHAANESSSRPSWIERLFGAKESPRSDSAKVDSADSPDASEEKADKKSKEAAKAKEASGEKKRSDKADKAEDKGKFTEEERELIDSWEKGNAGWKQSDKPLPPGLKKKVARGGELPPGWQKKLEVGTVLDPELDAQAETLPEEILRRFPESEVATEILRIGDKVVKVLESSREIVDILEAGSPAE